jgi:hypothetical protein
MLKRNHKNNNLKKNITLYKHKFIVFNSKIKDKKTKSSLRWLILLKTKKKYNVDLITSLITTIDWNFIIIQLDKIYSFCFTYNFEITYIISILSYFYFYYYCFKKFKSIHYGYTDLCINPPLISLKRINNLKKAYGFSFLKQKLLIKILILVFIVFKSKIIIKLIMFKYIGSTFCCFFLYAQSVFIINMVNSFYVILNEIQYLFNAEGILFYMEDLYSKYKKVSIILLFVVAVGCFSLFINKIN